MNARPTPPLPSAAWQLAHVLNSFWPSPTGPATTTASGLRPCTYMNPQIGNRLSVAIAQNGIFRRRLAAAMYGGSGFGGGATAGVPLGALAGVAGAAAAGVEDSTVAGVAAAAGASPGADSPPSAARRSFERFSRCSGISVTAVLSPRQSVRARVIDVWVAPTVERGRREK